MTRRAERRTAAVDPAEQACGGHLPRVFVPSALGEGAIVTLDRARSHHLCAVLRLGTGTRLRLFDGSGDEWWATLEGTGRAARVAVGARRALATESPLAIVLWQGVSQGSRMDACLRQAVELGVAELRPILGARGQVRLDERRAAKRCEHWQAIAVSAAEQSGRARVPRVHPPLRLQSALEASNTPERADGLALLLAPEATQALGDVVPRASDAGAPLPRPRRVDLLVGPESGFTAAEIERATAAGFRPVRAGPRTLRTETAGPAAIAILQARFGDMSA